jgi:hypothetical protein
MEVAAGIFLCKWRRPDLYAVNFNCCSRRSAADSQFVGFDDPGNEHQKGHNESQAGIRHLRTSVESLEVLQEYHKVIKPLNNEYNWAGVILDAHILCTKKPEGAGISHTQGQ